MRKSHVTQLTLCAMFAALTAILSQISIPIGPVPINLALLAVLLAGGMLGAKYGAISVCVYIALGAAGIPVFAGMKGGFSVVTGPTGGYIAGYVAAVWLTGFFAEGHGLRRRVLIPAMALGVAACYALGTAWFVLYSGTEPLQALSLCVLPFLPGDAVKIGAAAMLARELNKRLSPINGR